MWVVRKMYWRSGQQYVRKELDFATEIYETNLAVSNKGDF